MIRGLVKPKTHIYEFESRDVISQLVEDCSMSEIYMVLPVWTGLQCSNRGAYMC